MVVILTEMNSVVEYGFVGTVVDVSVVESYSVVNPPVVASEVVLGKSEVDGPSVKKDVVPMNCGVVTGSDEVTTAGVDTLPGVVVGSSEVDGTSVVVVGAFVGVPSFVDV